jgi:hypothetical protein
VSSSPAVEGSRTTHPLKSEIGNPVMNANTPPILRASPPRQCSTSLRYEAMKFSFEADTSWESALIEAPSWPSELL